MSTFYNFWKMAYLNGWVDLTKLTNAKDKGLITQEEYNEIVAPKTA